MDVNIKRRKSKNLFQRLSIGFFSIITCISVVITGGFSLHYKQQENEVVHKSIQQLSEINAKKICTVFEQMELSIRYMNAESSGIHEKLLLYSRDKDPRALYHSFEQIVALISNYINVALRPFSTDYHTFFFVDPSYDIYEQLSSVNIHTTTLDGHTWIYSDNAVQEEEWFQLALSHPNQSHWMTMDKEPGILYMAQRMEYLSVSNGKVISTPLGVILFKLDVSWIEESISMSSIASDVIFLLTDKKNEQILYTSNPKVIGLAKDTNLFTRLSTGQLLNQKKYNSEFSSVTNELNLVTLIPTTELNKNYVRTLMPFLLLLFVTLLIGGGFSIYFSHRMSRDILHLSQHMQKKCLTPVECKFSAQDNDINVLYNSYNTLVLQVQAAIRKQAEYQEEKKEMEIKLMQAQINPHFLNNSLNSIYNVAVLHNEDSIASAISGLCTFLHYNMSFPNIEVSLQYELDMLEHYILLQNFLCGDRIFFDYEMDINLNQTKIPKMLLQPLVENCIMHNNVSEFVEIMLSCQVREDKFVLVVEDNGLGNHIEKINQALQSKCDRNSENSKRDESNRSREPEQKVHGYGISNVHQRIKMRYGERYGLYYTNARNGGVAAHIELPLDIAVV